MLKIYLKLKEKKLESESNSVEIQNMNGELRLVFYFVKYCKPAQEKGCIKICHY